MSTAPEGILEQAQRLVQSARLLPADEAARVLERVATIAQAAQAEVLAAAERSGDLKESGCRTVRSFAMSILRRSAGDASGLAGVAVHLVAFPKLAAAYQTGLVHTPNLRTIIRHLRTCGLAVLQDHEDALVQLATQAGPAEVAVFCQALAEVHRPDGDEAKVRAAGLRSVRISPVGDLAHLDAMLDPALAARLKTTLSATAKASRTPDDSRTHGERTADALEQVLQRGMDTDQPAPDTRRARATVTVELETLLGMPGHGQALLSRFGLIPTGTAARLTCDALVTLVLTHGDRVLNLGRTRRTVTRRQRTALATTHHRCAMPGCQIPFADCDIHHLWWWHLAGPTDLDLQVPLCGTHHRRLHDGDYSITREHGRLVFRDPLGRTITNTAEVLQDQLALLHPPPPPLRTETDRWPDSPYLPGRWGRTGQDPDPPPEHPPPKHAPPKHAPPKHAPPLVG